MANVISGQETFMKMFPGEALGTLVKGITVAVATSFKEQSMKNPTHDETKRRFTICVDWAKTLRGDLKWGVQRVADEMVNVLRTELLGQRYQPNKREIWVPQDGAVA